MEVFTYVKGFDCLYRNSREKIRVLEGIAYSSRRCLIRFDGKKEEEEEEQAICVDLLWCFLRCLD